MAEITRNDKKVQVPVPEIISKYQKEPESTRFFRNYQEEQAQGVTGCNRAVTECKGCNGV